MLPSDLTLSALRFILSAKSRQSCLQDCETVDFCNSLKAVAPPGTMTEWGYACCEAQAPLVRGSSPSEPVAVKSLEDQSEGTYLACLVGCDDVNTGL